MKIIKIIIFLGSLSSLFLPNSAEKNILVTEQNERQSDDCKVDDFQHLATVWAEEYIKNFHREDGNRGLKWVDFDASQWETRSSCWSKDVRHRLKNCKIDMCSQNFQVNHIAEPWKSKQDVYHRIHINNSSRTDEVSFEKGVAYTESYIIATTSAFKWEGKVGVETKIGLPLGEESEIFVEFHSDWETSSYDKQRHEKVKNVTLEERLVLLPRSKTDIKLIMEEVNYDFDISTDVVIGGFFAVKCKEGAFWIFESGEILQYINDYPQHFSQYLKELAKDYTQNSWRESDYEYYGLKYNTTGKIQGVHGYKVSSEKNSILLNDKNCSNCPNKYYYLLIGATAGSLLTTTSYLGVRYWQQRGYEAIPN